MHIPDAYLGPITYIGLYIIMIPIWIYASYKLKRELRSKQVPILALSAAFAFVIMMFNMPLIGGTSGHATGGAIIAIILGPWAALVAMSVSLVMQALIFGDGGLTTLAANCFNMAFIIPFSAYIIYKLLSGRSPVTSKRRLFAALIAGYVSINIAAAFTGFELGIQPILYPAVDGKFTYFWLGLNVTMPIMVISHLFIGIAEALVTGLVFAYLQKNNPELIADKKAKPAKVKMNDKNTTQEGSHG